jgi:ribosomal protein S27E
MKKMFLWLIVWIFLSSPDSFLHSRPGMGGSYRSSSLGSSSGSTFRSSSSTTLYKSSSSSSSSSGSMVTTKQEGSLKTVTSPTWDIQIKIQKQGSLLVKEAYSPSAIQEYTAIRRVDPDILKGISTSSPPDREKKVNQDLYPGQSSLNYTLDRVFHPVYGNALGYIQLQQPYDNKNYSILIEQEDGLDIPSIDFWVATGGSSDYDGTNPFSFFLFEKEFELGKKYEFINDNYRHTIYFYIKYPLLSKAPLVTPIPSPAATVSYDSKIKLNKSGLSMIATKIDFSLKELPTQFISMLPLSAEYRESSESKDIAYPSFSGDWAFSAWGQNQFPQLKESSSSIQLDYETYGNFTEKEGRLEFDFHIPYIPLYTHEMSLKSYMIQIELPEGIEDKNINLSLYSAISGYGDYEDPAVVLHSISFEKKGNLYTLQSSEPISLPARLMVSLDLPASSLSTSIVLHNWYLLIEAIKSPLNSRLYLYSLPVYLMVLLIGIVLFTSFKKKEASINSKSSNIESLLIQKDPNFSISEFQKNAHKIASLLQSSWNYSKMETTRPHLSSGVFSRMTTQLELLEKKDGVINKMDEFQILSSSVEGYALENSYFSIHLKMNFSAKDVTLPKNSTPSQIQSALNSAKAQPYSEIYSFTRKISATTDASKSFLEGRCPSCGSETDFSHPTVKCKYCGNIFNSGEKDWVLSEITQMIEWKGVPQERTTEYSTQILEDRASSLFWKYLKAKTLGSPLSISREADPLYLKKETFTEREIYIPVVGAVDLEKLEQTEGKYEAQLLIKWSYAIKKGGEITGKESKLSMIRNKVSLETGFSETTCSQCGAPFPELDATTCEYCDTKIPKVVDDWILSEITHSHGSL